MHQMVSDILGTEIVPILWNSENVKEHCLNIVEVVGLGHLAVWKVRE